MSYFDLCGENVDMVELKHLISKETEKKPSFCILG